MLEIFNNQFAGIAEQMGIVLRNTASSVNVKERLDFSCAMFTAAGDLVVNAPHIPVHLGAMGETVRRILADNPDLAPGRRVCHQRPVSRRLAPARRDGRHAGARAGQRPAAVLHRQPGPSCGDRRHRPGSMPPFSRNLAEEGVLIRNFKLVDRGRVAARRARPAADSRRRIPRATWPTTWPIVAAQVAANRLGSARAGPAGRAVFAAGGRSLHAAHSGRRRAKMRQAGRAAGRPARRSSIISTTARRSPWPSRSTATRRIDRFHRHRPGVAGQFERQSGDRHGGGHVLPAHLAGRRHSAQPRRAGPGADRAARVPAESARRADARAKARPWSAATSKRRSAWSTCCWGPWSWRPPARAR